MYTPIIPLNYDVVYSCDAYDEVRENSLSISCSPSLRDTFKAYGITAELL